MTPKMRSKICPCRIEAGHPSNPSGTKLPAFDQGKIEIRRLSYQNLRFLQELNVTASRNWTWTRIRMQPTFKPPRAKPRTIYRFLHKLVMTVYKKSLGNLAAELKCEIFLSATQIL